MTTSETKFDVQLAWDLREVLEDDGIELPRDQIERLVRALSERGYAKPKGGLPSLSELRSMVEGAQSTLDEILKGKRV